MATSSHAVTTSASKGRGRCDFLCFVVTVDIWNISAPKQHSNLREWKHHAPSISSETFILPWARIFLISISLFPHTFEFKLFAVQLGEGWGTVLPQYLVYLLGAKMGNISSAQLLAMQGSSLCDSVNRTLFSQLDLTTYSLHLVFKLNVYDLTFSLQYTTFLLLLLWWTSSITWSWEDTGCFY